jgi:hypothetical protein
VAALFLLLCHVFALLWAFCWHASCMGATCKSNTGSPNGPMPGATSLRTDGACGPHRSCRRHPTASRADLFH